MNTGHEREIALGGLKTNPAENAVASQRLSLSRSLAARLPVLTARGIISPRSD
ncbi:MAG: hypothetical protein RIQ93_2958 [Verrucomicrobiota bacterium]|jgi:hypothetical protein